ncbi:MAG: hypothetical protein RIE86_13265 [Imperialibacter sp.]|uniref:hypothetical protein n=1 Tax=Imperialibacter sp. TaxID=2038411 RepID=UPI0032F07434
MKAVVRVTAFIIAVTLLISLMSDAAFQGQSSYSSVAQVVDFDISHHHGDVSLTIPSDIKFQNSPVVVLTSKTAELFRTLNFGKSLIEHAATLNCIFVVNYLLSTTFTQAP